MDILKKLRKNDFSISIAAVPEAYDFIGGHGAIVQSAQKKTKEDAGSARKELGRKIAENLAKLLRDPIIFTENRSGSMVAFVRQYGHFPAEKAFVERLLSERDSLF